MGSSGLMRRFLTSIHGRFRQDHFERQLYGADVVDAYIDLDHIRRFVQRRLPYQSGKRLIRVVYRVFDIADTGGRNGRFPARVRQNS